MATVPWTPLTEADWTDPEGPLVGAPAVHRQLKAWMAAQAASAAPATATDA